METLDLAAVCDTIERQFVKPRYLNDVVPDKRSADPGPIPRGRSLAKTRSGSPALQFAFVVMGPVLRRDDIEYAARRFA